ncbi:MAG: RIP metalloprotease RseP [Treponemataceae bacterium]
MIPRILVGLIGLGLVVFIHELGHFIIARLSGIEVEAFSIGWGKPIFTKRIGNVEYRIGSLPIGGYCKMKGETEFQDALAQRKDEIPREKGTFYGSPPLKRIAVAFAGPAANAIFAILALAAVWGCGIEVRTLGNRIVLASEVEIGNKFPADEAGLKTGDFITAIEGRKVSNFQEVQEGLAPFAGKRLDIQIERDGATSNVFVVPRLDPSTGAGKIGVYFWNDPIIDIVKKGTPAAIAGIRLGDRIVEANGKKLNNTVELTGVLKSHPSSLKLLVDRKGEKLEKTLVLSWADNGTAETGMTFATIRYRTPTLTPPAALVKGFQETVKTFVFSLKSMALLFQGIDLTKAVSGPVRITYMLGDVAADGFGEGIGEGLSAVASFLALLSIALFVMNLLPIPALDGGLILLFLIELIRGKALKPKTVYVFQLVGTAIVFGLLLFSLFGDILFLIGR